MLVVRSDKYHIPRFCNNLLSIESSQDGKKFYVESAKYVDVDRDMVFILDASSQSIVPTNGTIRRLGCGAVIGRMMELFGEDVAHASLRAAALVSN